VRPKIIVGMFSSRFTMSHCCNIGFSHSVMKDATDRQHGRAHNVFLCVYELIPWNRVLHEELIVIHVVKKFPAFTEPEYLPPCLQELSIASYHEPHLFSTTPHLIYLRFTYILLTVPELEIIIRVYPFATMISLLASHTSHGRLHAPDLYKEPVRIVELIIKFVMTCHT
jgi:hypothetical protein